MASVAAQVRLVRAAVEHLIGLEGQDRDLVIEMSQAMLADVTGGGLQPLAGYVGHYCDVAAGPEEAARIAAEIEAQPGSEDSE
jgi:hypothetical protein